MNTGRERPINPLTPFLYYSDTEERKKGFVMKNHKGTKKIDYFIERLVNFKQNFFSTLEKKEHLNERDLYKSLPKKTEKNRVIDKSSLAKVESLRRLTTKKT